VDSKRGNLPQEAGVIEVGRKLAITKPEATLRAYLEGILRTRFDANPCKPHCWFYYGFEDFILREGRFFTPRPQGLNTPLGAAGKRLLNSTTNSSTERLRYVEGYALAETFSLPALHAWNSDQNGIVVDIKWKPVGIAYFGVVIPRALVLAAGREHEIYSVIDNWYPLLERPWRKTLTQFAW